MKAIILAAGMGTRLRPLTDHKPKCLVEYKGVPLLDWILRALKASKINDIVIVDGYCREAITVPNARRYHNARYTETNMVHSLFCAEKELEGDVLISYSDIIYSPASLEPLLHDSSKLAVLIDKNWRALWQTRMQDPLQDAETLKLSPTGQILEIGKKPKSYEDIQGQYMGLIKVAASAWPEIRKFYHSLDCTRTYDGKSFDNMYMTSFLQLIIDQLMPVQAVLGEPTWLEVDACADLECEVAL